MKTRLLTIEAVLCGAPCFLFASGGLPIILFAGFRTLTYDMGGAVSCFLFVFAMASALVQYSLLTIQTIEKKIYRFGWMFRIAAVSASFGLWWTGRGFGWKTAAVVLGPIMVASLHFIALQCWRRKRTSHVKLLKQATDKD